MSEDDGEDEPDIYNDFNDILFYELEHDLDKKLNEEEEDYICDYIHTNKFWDRLFKKIPEAEGRIMF